MTVKELYRSVPPIIQSLLLTSEGWLVGSAVDELMEGKSPRDYDIITSPDLVGRTIKQLQSYPNVTMSINSYGGTKATFANGMEIDVWPEELGHFLGTAGKIGHIYNYTKRILIKRL